MLHILSPTIKCTSSGRSAGGSRSGAVTTDGDFFAKPSPVCSATTANCSPLLYTKLKTSQSSFSLSSSSSCCLSSSSSSSSSSASSSSLSSSSSSSSTSSSSSSSSSSSPTTAVSSSIVQNRLKILQSIDNSSTNSSESNSSSRISNKSLNECYFAGKATAYVLSPHEQTVKGGKSRFHNLHGNNIEKHLQSMFYLLREEDTLKMAVKLESVHPNRTRYLVVVSCVGKQNTEESCLLGIDCNKKTTIGLVLKVLADTSITLDGDGGFSVSVCGRHHIFKPVSVQAMWSALQTLHKVSAKAREFNYFESGFSHDWIENYETKINSERSCLNEWHAMDNLESRRPPSPDSIRTKPSKRDETENIIKSTLKEIMMSVDIDEVTSKYIRTRLEEELNMDLGEYKPFIDQEMLTILGQMDAPTEIFDHVFLGSEWNASNLEELQKNRIGHILNVTREIDNFFPGMFDYMNIRIMDDDKTDLLKYWDKTFKYIAKAKESGSRVLVHCKMGISRSASVVIAYAMKCYKWDLKKALKFVKTKRSCVKPNQNFIDQLVTYQGILDAMKNREKLQRSKSENSLKSYKRRMKSSSSTSGAAGGSGGRGEGCTITVADGREADLNLAQNSVHSGTVSPAISAMRSKSWCLGENIVDDSKRDSDNTSNATINNTNPCQQQQVFLSLENPSKVDGNREGGGGAGGGFDGNKCCVEVEKTPQRNRSTKNDNGEDDDDDDGDDDDDEDDEEEDDEDDVCGESTAGSNCEDAATVTDATAPVGAATPSPGRHVLMPCRNGNIYSVSPNQIVHLPNHHTKNMQFPSTDSGRKLNECGGSGGSGGSMTQKMVFEKIHKENKGLVLNLTSQFETTTATTATAMTTATTNKHSKPGSPVLLKKPTDQASDAASVTATATVQNTSLPKCILIDEPKDEPEAQVIDADVDPDLSTRRLPSRHSSWNAYDSRNQITPARNSSWGSYDLRFHRNATSETNDLTSLSSSSSSGSIQPHPVPERQSSKNSEKRMTKTTGSLPVHEGAKKTAIRKAVAVAAAIKKNAFAKLDSRLSASAPEQRDLIVPPYHLAPKLLGPSLRLVQSCNEIVLDDQSQLGIVKNLKKEFEAKTVIPGAAVATTTTPAPHHHHHHHPPLLLAPSSTSNAKNDDLSVKDLVVKYEDVQQVVATTATAATATDPNKRKRLAVENRSFNNKNTLRHSCFEIPSTIHEQQQRSPPLLVADAAAKKSQQQRPPIVPNVIKGCSFVVTATLTKKHQQQQHGKSHPLSRLIAKPKSIAASSAVYNTM